MLQQRRLHRQTQTVNFARQQQEHRDGARRAGADYAVEYTPYSTNDCSGTAAGPLRLTNALNVTAPGPNRNLAERCGINLMLVLDESGSIGHNGRHGGSAYRHQGLP